MFDLRSSATVKLDQKFPRFEALSEVQRGRVDGIVGVSPQIGRLRELIKIASILPGTVLITGETGTGKELVAHAIHKQSSRENQRLVTVNCAGVTATLAESEFFGHARGSFTGATSDRNGYFESANKGSLFLDEIGDLPAEMQVKILRAVDYGEVTKVGTNLPVRVDVRLIAATNRDIANDLKEGKFREDLFYRISGFRITIVPLRERKEDIPVLAEYFILEFNRKTGSQLVLDWSGAGALSDLSLPGNARELRNILETAAAFALTEDRTIITIKEVQNAMEVHSLDGNKLNGHESFQDASGIAEGAIDDFTKRIQVDPAVMFDVSVQTKITIISALHEAKGSRELASHLLGIDRRTLFRWIKLLEEEGITIDEIVYGTGKLRIVKDEKGYHRYRRSTSGEQT